MPIELGLWRIDDGKLQKLPMSQLDKEATLEDVLAEDLSLVSPDLMLLGRQVATAAGKFIDLLAMNAEGNLSIIELKKHRTPREVVAQTLDYASWAVSLSRDDIAELYRDKNGGKQLEVGFEEAFGASLPDELNDSHDLIIVSSELDSSTERIIGYLTDQWGVPINAVFFRHYEDDGRKYLARTWLVDPNEAERKTSRVAAKKGQEPWNGTDFYVSFGENEERNWEDALRYGFVSGGGGKWYTQGLKDLFPGARVFANIPKTGYVGVGTVSEEVVPVNDFHVTVDGVEMPILEASLEATEMGKDASDPELSQYLVRVEWEKTVPREKAYWETGLFANQHTACKLRSRFTIEKLTRHFGLEA